jgi:hypothetical protein
LKTTSRKIETTRLESWALPGLPDVLMCSESGVYSFLELKIAKRRSGRIDLSAHQCAWHCRNSSGPCFIVLRDFFLAIHVFHGARAVDLRMDNFTTVPALAVFTEPYNWKNFFELTSPIR